LTQLLKVFETAPAANRAEIARDFANALAAKGRNAEALNVIAGANIPEADSPTLTNLRAWLLVTNADASLNRPEEALALLEGIEQRGQSSNVPVLDSRAAALAAAGRYDEAAAIIQNLITEQERNNLPQDAATSRQRLERYKSGRPWTTQP
jgi:tetratricopeptide (TPR) repeat protein